MTTHSRLRGYPILFRGGEWIYEDTGLPTKDTYQDRPCGVCGAMPTPEGHDPCLGTLPGIMNACCGHGEPRQAYLQYEDRSCIRGAEAVREICRLKLIAKSHLTNR